MLNFESKDDHFNQRKSVEFKKYLIKHIKIINNN